MIRLNNINIEALRKSKLLKKVAIVTIPFACTMVISGCSKKIDLDDNDLARIVIAYVNGEPRVLEDVTNEYPYCNDRDYLAENLQHKHYRDVLTDELLTSGIDIECYNIAKYYWDVFEQEVTNVNVKKPISINSFLTSSDKEIIAKSRTDEDAKKEIIRNVIKEYENYQQELEDNKPNVLNLIHKN